jgi:hypothetical protein
MRGSELIAAIVSHGLPKKMRTSPGKGSGRPRHQLLESDRSRWTVASEGFPSVIDRSQTPRVAANRPICPMTFVIARGYRRIAAPESHS